MLLDSHGRPTKTKKETLLTEEDIIEAFKLLSAKGDGLAQQVFGISVWVEYLTDKINSFTLPDGTRPIQILEEEFNPFFQERYNDLVKEIEKARNAQANGANEGSEEGS